MADGLEGCEKPFWEEIMAQQKSFQVYYRLGVKGVVTDWQLLMMDWPYWDKLQAPDLLSAVHWRMRDISLAIKKLESDVCKVVEFKVVEIEHVEERLIVCNEIFEKKLVEVMGGQKPYYKVLVKGQLVHDGDDYQTALNFYSWN